MTERLKALRPKNGRGYELFDCSVLLFVLMYLGYVITMPSPTQMQVLSGVFDVISQQAFGAISAIAALYGMYAAYFPRLTGSGYVVTIATSALWSALFMVAFLEAVPQLVGELGRPLVYGAVVFATLVLVAMFFPAARTAAGSLLAILILVVIVDSAVNYQPSDMALEALRTPLSAVLYGWIARRLWREEDREYCEDEEI